MDFNDGGWDGEESQLQEGRKGELLLLEKGLISVENESLFLNNSQSVKTMEKDFVKNVQNLFPKIAIAFV